MYFSLLIYVIFSLFRILSVDTSHAFVEPVAAPPGSPSPRCNIALRSVLPGRLPTQRALKVLEHQELRFVFFQVVD